MIMMGKSIRLIWVKLSNLLCACSRYNFSSVISGYIFSPGIQLCFGMVGILKELSNFETCKIWGKEIYVFLKCMTAEA